MNILVLVESLRINETSSGIVSSTFLKALTTNPNNKITCIYNPVFNYKLSWLTTINFIKLEEKVYKKNKLVNSIPKLRGLITNVTGIHDKSLFEINRWRESIKNVLNNNKFDLIITLGSGSEFYPHYAMLKIETKITWLANFHDPYPMSVYPYPYKKNRNLLYWNQEKFTKKIIKKATYVSFPSLYLKKMMSKQYPSITEKSLILPHIGINLENLPEKKIDSSINLQNGKFNLLHAGTLLGPRKVEKLFSAFEKFLSKNKKRQDLATLNILGKIAREHKGIESTVKKFKSNFNIITDRVSYKKSLELTNKADVSLIIEADANFSPFMPGKLADLIYLERPIFALTPKKSETILILGNDYPYQARVNNENEILNTLEKLWANWERNNLYLPNKDTLKKYISAKEFNRKIDSIFIEK